MTGPSIAEIADTRRYFNLGSPGPELYTQDGAEDAQFVEYGTVLLDGLPVLVEGPVNYQNLQTLDRRSTFNDSTVETDDLISTYTIRDLSGGVGIYNSQEGANLNRYWTGTAMTAYPNMNTAGRKISVSDGQNTIGTETTYPMGSINDKFYAAYNVSIQFWSEGTESFVDTAHVLPEAPYAKATRFRGTGTLRLFIPHGTGTYGYSTFDGATVVTPAGAPKFIGFQVFDNKIWGLDTEGQIWRNDTGATTDWVPRKKLDGAYSPRGIRRFFDRSGNRAIHILADETVFVYDIDANVLIEANFEIPPHPDNMLGNVVWRDNLYFSAGLEIFRFQGSGISGVGFSGDDGLPADQLGYIVDLEAQLNGIYGLVQGFTGSTEPALTDLVAGTSFGKAVLEVPDLSAKSSLLWYTGQGIISIWESEGLLDRLTWSMVDKNPAGIQGRHYRMFWGAGGKVYSFLVPRAYHNPQQGMAAKLDKFAPTSYLVTPWYDMNFLSFKKLLSHLQMNLNWGDAGHTIQLEYQIDGEDAPWVSLGTASKPKGTLFAPGPLLKGPVQPRLGVSADLQRRGVAFDKIRFQLTWSNATEDASAIMDSLVVKFQRIPYLSRSWTINVVLSKGLNDMDPIQLRRHLEEVQAAEGYISFGYQRYPGDEQGLLAGYRAHVAGQQGNDDSGDSDNGFRVLNLVEVPILTPTFASQAKEDLLG